jgi:TPR repeat protein
MHVRAHCNVRHVAAGLAAAVRDNAVKEAEELCTSGQCAAALLSLQRAINLGHLPSLALMAWLQVRGREGVAEDRKAAAALANEGLGLGCHHCQGVMAYCHCVGFGGYTTLDPFVFGEDRALELARESSEKGSRYGQHTLGELLHNQGGSAVQRVRRRPAAAASRVCKGVGFGVWVGYALSKLDKAACSALQVVH